MDRSRWHNVATGAMCAVILLFGCLNDMKPPTLSLDLKKYQWLRGKKIFIDPGHGVSSVKDLFRTGPGGVTEEEVNLSVGRLLASMLKEAGADVAMSRGGRRDTALDRRIEKAVKYKPDLLVSIHHNGTIRRMDRVNYPSVLIWGSPVVNPASYDAAGLLLDEFHRMMNERGSVIADFAVFPETGTKILRETRYLCPGILGEGGFFSDETHALRLKDPQYHQREAEAYFSAVAEYFKRGVPSAAVTISSPLDNSGPIKALIRDKSPLIVIKTESGADGVGVDRRSLRATLNGVRVQTVPVTDGIFRIDYGRELYPGVQRLRFSFKNTRQQHSMIYSSVFTMEVKKGDYDLLVREGITRISRNRNVTEGLRMLKGALSLEVTGPKADELVFYIARAYSLLGERENASYYYARLHYFYPQSPYRKKIPMRITGHRYPVEYLGKTIPVMYDPDLTPVKSAKSTR